MCACVCVACYMASIRSQQRNTVEDMQSSQALLIEIKIALVIHCKHELGGSSFIYIFIYFACVDLFWYNFVLYFDLIFASTNAMLK